MGKNKSAARPELVDLKDYVKTDGTDSHTTSIDITKKNYRYAKKRRINISKLTRDVLTTLETNDRKSNPQDFINEPED